MKKWWIERENGNFDFVDADDLKVEAGTLVFLRSETVTLVVPPGTFVSVHLDEQDLSALATPSVPSVLTRFARSGRTSLSALRGVGVRW